MPSPSRRFAAVVLVAIGLLGAPTAALAKSAGPDKACRRAINAMAKPSASTSAALTGTPGDLDASVKALKASAAKAPKAIKADMKKLTVAYVKTAKLLKQIDYDPKSGKMPSMATLAKLEQATKGLTSKDLDAASKRLTAWFATHCGGT